MPNTFCCNWFPAPVLSLPPVCEHMYIEAVIPRFAEGVCFNMRPNLVLEGKAHLPVEVVAASSSLCSWVFPSVLPTFHTAAEDVLKFSLWCVYVEFGLSCYFWGAEHRNQPLKQTLFPFMRKNSTNPNPHPSVVK